MVDDQSAQEIPESSENVKTKGGNVTYEKAPDTDALVSESDRDQSSAFKASVMSASAAASMTQSSTPLAQALQGKIESMRKQIEQEEQAVTSLKQ